MCALRPDRKGRRVVRCWTSALEPHRATWHHETLLSMRGYLSWCLSGEKGRQSSFVALTHAPALPLLEAFRERAIRLSVEALRLPAEASLAPPLLLVVQELAAVAFSGGGSTPLSLATRSPRLMRDTPGGGCSGAGRRPAFTPPIISRNTDRLLFAADDPAGVVDGDIVGIITQADRLLALTRAGPSPDHERGCVKPARRLPASPSPFP